MFQVAGMSIDDDEHPGRLSTSTDDPHVDKINTLMRANRRLTIRELAEECGISGGSCYEILIAKLKMHRIATKFVPRLITDDQKANRIRVGQELLDRSDEDENFLSRITSTQNFTVIRCCFGLSILQSHKRKIHSLFKTV